MLAPAASSNSEADSRHYTQLRLTKANVPPRTYVTGISRSGRRELVVEVSAKQHPDHCAVVQAIMELVETENLDKAAALRCKQATLDAGVDVD